MLRSTIQLDGYPRELQTLTHEAGHAAAVAHVGGRLLRVIGTWREAREDHEGGSFEWLSSDLPAEHNAFVCLAGRAGAEGLDVLLDAGTPDEAQAAALVPATVLERLRGEVLAWTWRRDVAAQIIALALALRDQPVISGVEAENILRAVPPPA